MYGPDAYLFETNLTLLATLSDDELAEASIVAQLNPGTTLLAELGTWLVGACSRGLRAFAARLTPSLERLASYRVQPPLY